MSSGTPTPILGLHTFEDDDSMLSSEVNENSDIIDLLPPTICTSGTRPTTQLFSGRRIYETDTKRMYAYISGSWVLVGSVPIMVKRQRTTTAAVADGATTVLDNFQTSLDSFNSPDLPHSAGAFTVARSGFYVISFTGEWSAVADNGSGVGRRRFHVRLNSSPVYEGPQDDMPASGQSLNSAIRMTVRAELNLVLNDVIQIGAVNTTGTAQTVSTNSIFTMYRVF